MSGRVPAWVGTPMHPDPTPLLGGGAHGQKRLSIWPRHFRCQRCEKPRKLHFRPTTRQVPTGAGLPAQALQGPPGLVKFSLIHSRKSGGGVKLMVTRGGGVGGGVEVTDWI